MSRKIRILAAPAEDDTESKTIIGRRAEAVMAQVDINVLQRSLNQLSEDVGELLANAPTSEGFRLKQVTVGVEISAEGGVTLIGTLTAGAKAAVTLTFERS